MRISRLFVVAALVGACCLAATASASAATTATCTGATGKIKLSPGLTETAAVQNIQVKGELTGCTGENAKETYKFQVHAKTAEPVTCAALTAGALSGEETTLKIKSSGEGNSEGSASFQLIEGSGTLTSGALAGGPFEGGTASGTLGQSYTNGAGCGKPIITEKNGKVHEKAAKKVNKGTLTGAAVTIS
jgi:hypothetical protein